MLSFRRARAAAIVAACALVACARRKPPTDPVNVSITSTDESVRVIISERGHDGFVLRCRTPCGADLPPRDYVIEVRPTHTTPSAREIVRVKQPTRVVIEPGSKDAMIGGAILGTVGIAALVLGTFQGLGCWGEESRHDCGHAGEIFLAGLFATPAGWTIFGVNHTRIWSEVVPAGMPKVSLTPGGGSVGWTFTF
jgi:hypothetical protein